MAGYRFRACGVDGSLVEGVIDAVSQEAANDALWLQGLTPFEVRPDRSDGTKWWQREIILGGGSQAADLVAFTREFSTLNSADIPLDDALRILCDQASSSRLRAVVAIILADVLNGAPLSDAMQKQSNLFPVDYVSVVRAGEVGGTLDQIFVDLAELLERRLEMRARIQSALIYPCMLVILSLVTLAIIIGGLIPSIAPIFVESGKPIPATVQFMLTVQERWFEGLLAIAFLATFITAALSMAIRRPSARLTLDRYKLKVPLFGAFLLNQETARFARTLGTMLKAGVPLVQATKSGHSVIGNRHIAAGVHRVIEAVQEGVPFHRALRSETELPQIALQMISVGEESGKLDRMAMRVAIMLEKQIQSSIDRFMAALTPILTVSIALMVGAIIMPVMNAVLSINEMALR